MTALGMPLGVKPLKPMVASCSIMAAASAAVMRVYAIVCKIVVSGCMMYNAGYWQIVVYVSGLAAVRGAPCFLVGYKGSVFFGKTRAAASFSAAYRPCLPLWRSAGPVARHKVSSRLAYPGVPPRGSGAGIRAVCSRTSVQTGCRRCCGWKILPYTLSPLP